MLPLLIIAAALLSLYAFGFVIMRKSIKDAPLGYEDATGFHYGKEPVDSAR